MEDLGYICCGTVGYALYGLLNRLLRKHTVYSIAQARAESNKISYKPTMSINKKRKIDLGSSSNNNNVYIKAQILNCDEQGEEAERLAQADAGDAGVTGDTADEDNIVADSD